MFQSKQTINHQLLPVRLVLTITPGLGLVLLLLGLLAHTETPRDFRLPLAVAESEFADRVYHPLDSAAVQFVIDESAGLSGSGNCVDPRQVLVVDEEEMRYDIPRFFLALWGTYHDVEAWKLRDDVQAEPAELFVGLTQFGATYSQTLPITQVTNLRGEPGDRYHQLLSSAADAQRGFSDQFFCKTHFDQALRQAAESLHTIRPGENIPRILVLITDGVFLGFSPESASNCQQNGGSRDCARAAVVAVLQEFQSHELPIQLYVILLGADRCHQINTSVSDHRCDQLSEGEHRARLIDLNNWRGWASTYGFTLLESGPQSNLLVDLAESVDIKPLLPSHQQFTPGWITSKGTMSIDAPGIPGADEDLWVVLITLADAPNLEIEHSQERSPLIGQYAWTSLDEGAFIGKARLTSQPDCPLSNLRLFSRQEEVAYYWIDTSRGEPEVALPEIDPDPIVMNHSQEVTVTATFDSNDVAGTHRGCYLIDVEIVSELGKEMQGAEARRVSAEHNFTTEVFTLNHEGVQPWGTLTATAFIRLADSGEVIATRQMNIATIYETDVLTRSVEVSPPNFRNLTTGEATFTISIDYGGKIRQVNGDFQPQFKLYPFKEERELTESEAQHFDGNTCAIFSPEELDKQQVIVPVHWGENFPFTLTYEVEYPIDAHLERSCYAYLRVFYLEPGGRTVERWIDLDEIEDPAPGPTDTPPLPPNGTRQTIPTSTGQSGENGNGRLPRAWLVALFVIFLVVAVLVVAVAVVRLRR